MSVRPTCDDTVSHRRIDADAWANVFVVGDVHGCPEALDRLLGELDPDPSELVVLVGDLVGEGPDSQAVVERVRTMDNAVSVLGDEEATLRRGEEPLPGLTPADREYIEAMPVAVSWGDVLVVHGGVDHRKPLADHTVEELLGMRSLVAFGEYTRPLWFETRSALPRVFFGHTVLSGPFATPYAVGLDTGCVHGRGLTAYDCGRNQFVTVDSTEYEPRSADDVVAAAPDVEQFV